VKAYAPNGEPICGTYERITGRADTVEDSFTRKPDGTLDFDHAGYTEVFWDGQETVTNNKGQIIFLDAEGNEWTEDQIELRP